MKEIHVEKKAQKTTNRPTTYAKISEPIRIKIIHLKFNHRTPLQDIAQITGIKYNTIRSILKSHRSHLAFLAKHSRGAPEPAAVASHAQGGDLRERKSRRLRSLGREEKLLARENSFSQTSVVSSREEDLLPARESTAQQKQGFPRELQPEPRTERDTVASSAKPTQRASQALGESEGSDRVIARNLRKPLLAYLPRLRLSLSVPDESLSIGSLGQGSDGAPDELEGREQLSLVGSGPSELLPVQFHPSTPNSFGTGGSANLFTGELDYLNMYINKTKNRQVLAAFAGDQEAKALKLLKTLPIDEIGTGCLRLR